MFLKKPSVRRIVFGLTLLLALNLLSLQIITAQQANNIQAQKRAEAMKMVEENRYIDALPVLEKLAPQMPKDAEIWAHYGIAILVKSSTLKTPEERKAERKRGREALAKAAQLGTTIELALHYLETIPPDGGTEDNFSGGNPEVEKALREGEGFFGRGEYDKAFAAYEKAYKIDPKNYEAVVFMGDSLYAQKKYKESEPWFAKAVEINPDREFAYRFWGDALYYQNKYKEAYQKFAEAFAAEPFSRMARDRFFRFIQEVNAEFAPVSIITPPGGEVAGVIKLDPAIFKAADGTANWKFYTETRDAWKATEFKKQFPKESVYRHTLAEESAALRKVIEAVKKDKQIKIMDESLANLIKLDEMGLLESYILFVRIDDGLAEDYYPYREKNREKLRRFVTNNFFVF
jgi:tetratricopeptide (TPR) repeat protein